jgi:hypothetical protein
MPGQNPVDKWFKDRTLNQPFDKDHDIYCIGCGGDVEDGAYKYSRTVANGDEYYCENCKCSYLHNQITKL